MGEVEAVLLCKTMFIRSGEIVVLRHHRMHIWADRFEVWASGGSPCETGLQVRAIVGEKVVFSAFIRMRDCGEARKLAREAWQIEGVTGGGRKGLLK